MIQERLNLVLKDKNLKLGEMAKLCSIPYKTLQNYTLGKTNIGEDALRKICITLEVNLNWLIIGEGNMYRTTAVASELSGTKTIEEIDDALRLLDEEQRQEIFSRTQEMLKVNTMEREMKEMRVKLERLEQAKKE